MEFVGREVEFTYGESRVIVIVIDDPISGNFAFTKAQSQKTIDIWSRRRS